MPIRRLEGSSLAISSNLIAYRSLASERQVNEALWVLAIQVEIVSGMFQDPVVPWLLKRQRHLAKLSPWSFAEKAAK